MSADDTRVKVVEHCRNKIGKMAAVDENVKAGEHRQRRRGESELLARSMEMVVFRDGRTRRRWITG
jgi:hypothetical protein